MYYMKCLEPHLEHHGILNQKKGVRNGPPYPLARDSMGRLKTKVQEKRKAATAAKVAKKTDEGTKKAVKKVSDEETKKEQLKKELRAHPERLYKHRDELSKEEIDAIVSQIKWDKNIREVSDEAHARNVNKLKKIVADTAQFAANSWTIYNNLRNFANAFSGGSSGTSDKKSEQSKRKPK